MLSRGRLDLCSRWMQDKLSLDHFSHDCRKTNIKAMGLLRLSNNVIQNRCDVVRTSNVKISVAVWQKQVVQNLHTGEQMTHYDMLNKKNSNLVALFIMSQGASPHQWIFHSLPLNENHFYQPRKGHSAHFVQRDQRWIIALIRVISGFNS